MKSISSRRDLACVLLERTGQLGGEVSSPDDERWRLCNMKLIDARSGQVVSINAFGRTAFSPPVMLNYGADSTAIYSVQMGFLSGKALVTTKIVMPGSATPQTRSDWVPLQTRFMHPGYPLERVAFIPS
jgi:hypothetical protein